MERVTTNREPTHLDNTAQKGGEPKPRVSRTTQKARAPYRTSVAQDKPRARSVPSVHSSKNSSQRTREMIQKLALGEMVSLNLDYAEAEKAMLNQALKLKKRFG